MKRSDFYLPVLPMDPAKYVTILRASQSQEGKLGKNFES